MQSGSTFSDQPQSQPTLPSQKSLHYHNVAARTAPSQRQAHVLLSRPLVYLPHSPVVHAPCSGTLPLQPFHASSSPYQYQHQQSPFFTQGPAATKYNSQRVPKHQEPIVSLRQAFSTVDDILHHDKSQTLGHLGSACPHSVPSPHIQPTATIGEHFASQVPRPVSAVNESTQRLFAFGPLDAHRLFEKDEEQSSRSPTTRDVSSNTTYMDDEIPLKRELPFFPRKPAKFQMGSGKKQAEIEDRVSPPQDAGQGEKVGAPRSESPNKPAKSKVRKAMKRSKGAFADTFQALERGKKSRLVGPYAHNDSNAAPESSSRTQTGASQPRECSPPYCIKVNRDLEPGDTFVAPNSATDCPPSTVAIPDFSSQHERDRDPRLSQQQFTRMASVRGTRLSEYLGVTTEIVTKRPASQVSMLSSKAQYSMAVDDVIESADLLNPRLPISERMAGGRDISDIVDICLLQGEVDMLAIMNVEILISKAVRDAELFKVMEKFLK